MAAAMRKTRLHEQRRGPRTLRAYLATETKLFLPDAAPHNKINASNARSDRGLRIDNPRTAGLRWYIAYVIQNIFSFNPVALN
jgi:hypothetical protein